jgi:hypothetical protein
MMLMSEIFFSGTFEILKNYLSQKERKPSRNQARGKARAQALTLLETPVGGIYTNREVSTPLCGPCPPFLWDSLETNPS